MRTNRIDNSFQDIELGHAPLRNPSQPRSAEITHGPAGDTLAASTSAGRFKKHLLSAVAVGSTLLGGGLVAAIAVPVLKQQRNQALASRNEALAQLATGRNHYFSAAPIADIEHVLQAAPTPAPALAPSDSDTSANVQVTMGGVKQTLKQAMFYKSGEGIELLISNHPNLCDLMTGGPAISDFLSGLTLQTTLYNVAPFGAGYSWTDTLVPVQDGLYGNVANIVAPGKWSDASVLTDGLNGQVTSRLAVEVNLTSAFPSGPNGNIAGEVDAAAIDDSGSYVSGTFKASRCVSAEDMIADTDAYEEVNVVAEAIAEEQRAQAPSPEAERP